MRVSIIFLYTARWLDFKSVSDIIGWDFLFPPSIRGLVATAVVAVMWALWKARNVACFSNSFMYHPTNVIVETAHWMDSWAIFRSKVGEACNTEDQERIFLGCIPLAAGRSAGGCL
jgi:hypothetical protein